MMKKLVLSLLAVLALNGSAYAVTTHIVGTGDTLWALACKHYGDGSLYTVIAEVNGVSNPRTILNGTVLIIPDKADMKKIAAESDSSRRKQLISQATGSKTINTIGTGNTKPSNSSGSSKPSVYVEPHPDDTSFKNVLNREIKEENLKAVHKDEIPVY